MDFTFSCNCVSNLQTMNEQLKNRRRRLDLREHKKRVEWENQSQNSIMEFAEKKNINIYLVSPLCTI